MTDIEYLYRQDIREKKAAGRGVYGKRTGSKSRYVSLPQNYMSESQLKRRNGPMVSYNINLRNDWKSFKSMPKDLQKAYLQNIIFSYNINAQDVADSFGVCKNTMLNYLKAEDIHVKWRKTGRKKLSDERWPDFIAGARNVFGVLLAKFDTPVEEVEDTPTPVEEPLKNLEHAVLKLDEEDDISPAPAILYKVTVEMDGTTKQLTDMIAMLTDSSRVYEFELCIKEKGVVR